MSAHLQLGLPPGLRPQAAALYWQAFGGKLGRVMGPEAKALAYLTRVIRDDHAIVALEGDRLLGLAGFRTPQGSFAVGDQADLVAVHGAWGGAWRGALLRRLSSEVDNRNFLLDGLCVAEGHRGQGLGRALMGAIAAEARLRGYPGIRLDVVRENTRARALYARLGYAETKTQGIGLLRPFFGFAAAVTMVRDL
ncbi:GNAT family N-acetyltransferase [Rhodobacter sp. KR11]|uniref:GNAT family N-acetyltransferase n=1 Tax=Rhodobacter sp. KR11 TaxID=2974588 RepID=UPI0022218BC3|nr:GNAT family N-acetyltransferase [Rhodobacter sp. KR11]MCW1920048.1 GNAT family N-acetyltransferase [Rhodobacter sp. KR11]